MNIYTCVSIERKDFAVLVLMTDSISCLSSTAVCHVTRYQTRECLTVQLCPRRPLSPPRRHCHHHGDTVTATATLSPPRRHCHHHGDTVTTTATLSSPRRHCHHHGDTFATALDVKSMHVYKYKHRREHI